MEFKTCVSGRRSVRKFKADKLDVAVLKKIVEVAACSPSWKNSQTTRYIVVQSEQLRNEIADKCVMDFAHNQKIIKNAPAVILVTTITGRSGFEKDGTFSTSEGTHWESFDAGIAAGTLCLAAHDQGVGTVILGIFDEEKVTKVVGIPEGQKLSAIVAIGYPDEAPVTTKRKEVEELLSFAN